MALSLYGLLAHVVLAAIVTAGVVVTLVLGLSYGIVTAPVIAFVLVVYVVGNSAHAISVATSGLEVSAQGAPTLQNPPVYATSTTATPTIPTSVTVNGHTYSLT